MSKPRLSPFEKAVAAIGQCNPTEQACLRVLLKTSDSPDRATPPVNEATKLGTRMRGRPRKGLPADTTPPDSQ